MMVAALRSLPCQSDSTGARMSVAGNRGGKCEDLSQATLNSPDATCMRSDYQSRVRERAVAAIAHTRAIAGGSSTAAAGKHARAWDGRAGWWEGGGWVVEEEESSGLTLALQAHNLHSTGEAHARWPKVIAARTHSGERYPSTRFGASIHSLAIGSRSRQRCGRAGRGMTGGSLPNSPHMAKNLLSAATLRRRLHAVAQCAPVCFPFVYSMVLIVVLFSIFILSPCAATKGCVCST